MLAEPPTEPTFFMTVNANRRQLKPHIKDGDIPVMRNVMQFRRDDGTLRVSKPYAGRYVLDSGGYTAMDEFGGDFPWTVEDYHLWADQMYSLQPFEWTAVMDLACEEDFDADLSVEARIERTVDNTIRHLNLDPAYPVLPVLQGRTVEQWIDCYDRLRDHGIDPEYVGVGTLCRQTSGPAIADIISALRARTDIEAFHGFGVKSTAFKHGAVFETADSNAWAWPIQFGLQIELTDDDPPVMTREPIDGEANAVAHQRSFTSYYQYVSRLQREAYESRGPPQATLGSF